MILECVCQSPCQLLGEYFCVRITEILLYNLGNNDHISNSFLHAGYVNGNLRFGFANQRKNKITRIIMLCVIRFYCIHFYLQLEINGVQFVVHAKRMSLSRMYTHKNAQVVTNLFRSCRQVVFALLVPSCCDKFETSLVSLSNLLQSCSNKSDTVLI